MQAKDLLSAAFTVLGAAALLAASGVLTIAVTMAALDGTWTQVIDFNDVGEGPLELALAWALLPAVGWVLRGALENEVSKLAAAREREAGHREAELADGQTGTADTAGDRGLLGFGPTGRQPGAAQAVDATPATANRAPHPLQPSPIDASAEPVSELPAALAWARAYTEVPDARRPPGVPEAPPPPADGDGERESGRHPQRP